MCALGWWERQQPIHPLSIQRVPCVCRALPWAPVTGRAKTRSALEEPAVKLEDKTRPWGSKQRVKAEEQQPVTGKQRACEKMEQLMRSRSSLDPREGAREEGAVPVGSPPSPHGHSGEGKAFGRRTGGTAPHYWPSEGVACGSWRDKPPICLVAPPFPGEVTERPHQDLLWASKHQCAPRGKEERADGRRGAGLRNRCGSH